MAKTKLNQKVDSFFDKYSNQEITKKVIENHFDIRETNEYGNILHAIVNYEYPKNATLKVIELLLDMGVDPNYRGKLTGMTFLHLMLYGYTNQDNQDCSYSEDYILKIIPMAISHGFDVNITDNDNETVALAAVASEVYEGSVVTILKVLGPKYKIDESFLEVYNNYLDSSATENQKWHDRLKKEQKQVKEYIMLETLRIEEINGNINKIFEFLTTANGLNYPLIQANCTFIAQDLNILKDYIDKKKLLKYSTTEDEKNVLLYTNNVISVLENELESIQKKPSTSRIHELQRILDCFHFEELCHLLEKIKNEYEEHLAMLMDTAQNVDTLSNAKRFLESVKACEIYEKLENIVHAKINDIHAHSDKLVSSYKELEELNELLSGICNIAHFDIDFKEKTIPEIDFQISEIEKVKANYKIYVLEYLTNAYRQIFEGIQRLVSHNYITTSDLETCFHLSLKPKEDKDSHD